MRCKSVCGGKSRIDPHPPHPVVYQMILIVSSVRSKLDYLHMWQRRILGRATEQIIDDALDDDSNLTPEQYRVTQLVQRFLQQRQIHYGDIPEFRQPDSSDSEENDNDAFDERNVDFLPATSGHDWRKFILIRGKPEPRPTKLMQYSGA